MEDGETTRTTTFFLPWKRVVWNPTRDEPVLVVVVGLVGVVLIVLVVLVGKSKPQLRAAIRRQSSIRLQQSH